MPAFKIKNNSKQTGIDIEDHNIHSLFELEELD